MKLEKINQSNYFWTEKASPLKNRFWYYSQDKFSYDGQRSFSRNLLQWYVLLFFHYWYLSKQFKISEHSLFIKPAKSRGKVVQFYCSFDKFLFLSNNSRNLEYLLLISILNRPNQNVYAPVQARSFENSNLRIRLYVRNLWKYERE